MGSGRPAGALEHKVTLVETLDRLLNQGVVVAGDVTLSVADVDLIHVGLRLLLCSVESTGTQETRSVPGPSSRMPAQRASESRTIQASDAAPWNSPEALDGTCLCATHRQAAQDLPKRINADPEKVEHGLLKLVLTVVELLRRLMEQQALRRVEASSLSPEEIERMGVTFLRLEEKMAELLAYFHLRKEDLTLSLGPLGDLM